MIGGPGEIRTHDLFHAMEAPANHLRTSLKKTQNLCSLDLAQLWHVVARIRYWHGAANKSYLENRFDQEAFDESVKRQRSFEPIPSYSHNLDSRVADGQPKLDRDVRADGSSSDWRKQLLRSKPGGTHPEGAIVPVLANAIVALRAAPEWKGVLTFDEFELQPTTLRSAPWGGQSKQRWSDQEDRLTAEWLQRHGIMVIADIAGQAVETVARDRRYHPIRGYLGGLIWDGVERIDRWLSAYLGADENDYIRAVGSRWRISAVARVYQPGVKADCCLILEGPQGAKNRRLCAR